MRNDNICAAIPFCFGMLTPQLYQRLMRDAEALYMLGTVFGYTFGIILKKSHHEY
jgi:hypothetical protein